MSKLSRRPACARALNGPAFRAIEALERRVLLTTFIVTNTGDNGGVNPTAGAGTGTLRQAIVDSDANYPGYGLTNTIDFNIPGNGLQSITLADDLPAIYAPVVIDGTSQPGFSGVPVIEVNDKNQTAGPGLGNVLLFEGGNDTNGSVVEGLDLVGGDTTGGSGVLIYQANGITISGDYIGPDLSNTGQPANSNGILINANTEGGYDEVIGGTTPAARNVISGNSQVGIDFTAAAANTGSGTVIEGNYIGTDPTGTQAVPNNSVGIFTDQAGEVTIGGTAAGAGNLISGNGTGGIWLGDNGTSNQIVGNYIGTDVTGTKALGNGGDGIRLNQADDYNLIQSNVIDSSNPGYGVDIIDASNNTLTRNIIGTDPTGTIALGNVIGGVNINGANYGSGPTTATNNLIGGTLAAAGNVIAFNDGDGVGIFGTADTGNAVRFNSIYSNAGLGIDLQGFANNSPGGPHSGENDLQNVPILLSAVTSTSGLAVTGSLNSTPNSMFLIDFYSNTTLGLANTIQGKTPLGFTEVTTDALGNATFSTTLPTSVAVGQYLTATATSAALYPVGDTSEFTPPIQVTAPVVIPPPTPTGSLSGSQVTAGSSYNLTMLGTTDWAQWGKGGTYGQFNHKASGGSQISNVTQINPGGASFGGYHDSSRSATWTDGTPTASDSNEHGYIWANNVVGAGYSFTVPAGTTAQTLFVYAGGYNSGLTLTAHLSGGSAADYVGTASSSSGIYTELFTINFQAASAGQTLTISLVKNSSVNDLGGSVDLIAAALDAPAGPDKAAPTAALTSAPTLTTDGSTAYSFSVTFSDNVAVKASTLGNSNILVTGPGGYSQLATLTSTGLSNGPSVVATYSVPAPAGGWSSTTDGSYNVALEGTQVSDTSSNFAAAGKIGSFAVNIAAPGAGSLVGSQITAVSSYNLTTLGTTDWAHWGRGGVYGRFDHKASGGSQISNVTQINPGGASFGGYTDNSRSTTWTDGTPTASDSNEHGYIWANNAVGAGFSFTVPAGTTSHTLYVYAGGYDSGATLTAHLSDGMEADYVATASSSGRYNELFTITFKAASAGQTLTISLVKNSMVNNAGGSVDLMAAALV